MSAHFENPPPNPYQAANYGLKQEDEVKHFQSMPPQSSFSPLSHGAHASSSLQSLPSASAGPSTMTWPATDSPQSLQPGYDSSLMPSVHPSMHQSDYATTYQQMPLNSHHSMNQDHSSSKTFKPSVEFQSLPSDRANKPGMLNNSHSQPPPPKPRARHLGKVFAAPIDRPRSLDDVAPRATFLSVISLYFHHLYPLMPIVHQPSFSHDLITRRDERDTDFLSFVLSLTAYTLIQCPRSVIPAPWPFYRKLHQICHLTSRKIQLERHNSSDPPTLTQCATLYTTHIYMGSTSRTFAANAIHGELVRTAFSINLHDETRPLPTASGVPAQASQRGPPELTEIERQLRRRLYYLIYGSDKTISILSDEPISLRDADTVGVEIPVAVDDDAIFPHKIGDQPAERGPSILCGFEAVSKLHRIMSDLMENFRADRRIAPPNAEATHRKLHYARSILYQIRAVIADMPDVLRKPSFEHTEPPPRPAGALPDLGVPFYQMTAPSNVNPGSSQVGQQKGNAVGSNTLSQQQSAQMYSGQGSMTLPFTPWPLGTFDENGLPIPSDGASQTSSSAAASPTTANVWQSGTFTASNKGFIGGPFAPQGPSLPGSPVLPSSAQLNAAREQVVAFRPSPPLADPGRAQVPILSGFAICRANILVTEAMLRFVLVDYQELLQGYLNRQRSEEGPSSASAGFENQEDGANDIEEAAQSFFAEAVAALPLDALAANGQSLILKLVFIVSSLLNRTSSSSRAFTYMSEFLQTLSRLSERRTAGDEDPGSDDEDVPSLTSYR